MQLQFSALRENMMYHYCFLKEDIQKLNDHNPLMLQIRYAQHLGLFLCCSLAEKIVTDITGTVVRVENLKIFLRASYDVMEEAIELLETKGAILLETVDDIRNIEDWGRYNLSVRSIYNLKVQNILEQNYSADIRKLLDISNAVFLKTKRKGFTAKVLPQKIVQREADLIEFLQDKCPNLNDELLITDYLMMRKDSFGKKEFRTIVLEGEIFNVSREVHSVRHIVPAKWIKEAELFVDKISFETNLPSNYVLDIGEFEDEGHRYWDIVEMNPITSSLCYVNNSIFSQCTDEILEWYRKTGMGKEYCYDACLYPNMYVLERDANKSYEYTNEERYSFLSDV
jgi:hypothetical protein